MSRGFWSTVPSYIDSYQSSGTTTVISEAIQCYQAEMVVLYRQREFNKGAGMSVVASN